MTVDIMQKREYIKISIQKTYKKEDGQWKNMWKSGEILQTQGELSLL